MWNGLESKMFLTKASKFDICSSNLFFKERLFKELKLQFNHVDRSGGASLFYLCRLQLSLHVNTNQTYK